MRTLLCTLLAAGLVVTSIPGHTAEPPPKKTDPAVPPGMKVYFVGLLKRGPKWDPAEETDLAKFLGDHVAYLAKLEKEGRVVVAGTFLGSTSLRGMVVYQARSLAEARALVKEDPAVQSGRLLIDVYPWLSAEGLRVVAPPVPSRPPAKAPPKKQPPPARPEEKTGATGKNAPADKSPQAAEPKQK
jgi:uncharacterized protein YciI